MPDPKKILLGQLGRRGDCLYATAVARQIKHDFPNSHLTWAINPRYRSVIELNPFVDTIWEVEPGADDYDTWDRFKAEALARRERGEFDELFLTQVHPGNYQNYDGTVRSSMFRGYPSPISESVQPVVRLSNQEISNVEQFVRSNGISRGDVVILFECASTSNQSFVTPEFAVATATHVLRKRNDVRFVLSSDIRIGSENPRILDGSVLPFMENAELTKYCTLVVGCSSGVSWLATSDWAKPLPTIQLLSRSTGLYASMVNDARYFGLPTDNILELYSLTAEEVAEVILFALNKGFPAARGKFVMELPVSFDFYFRQLYSAVLSKKQILAMSSALRSAHQRYERFPEARSELRRGIEKTLAPYFSWHWERLNRDERDGITTMMTEMGLPMGGGYLRRMTGFLRLSTESVGGDYAECARLLLKDIVRDVTRRQGQESMERAPRDST